MSRGAISRSRAAGIAPGRITRGARSVQSTTVEGGDGVSVPPSSSRSAPRASASPHCCTNLARGRGGGNPWPVRAGGGDRVSVRPDEPLQRRDATSSGRRSPPSGPRSASGTRFSPPGSTRVSGPGQYRAARLVAIARQVEIEALDHVAPGDEQEEWLSRRPPLERTSESTESRSMPPPNPYTVSVG